jgi:hypothetical protein
MTGTTPVLPGPWKPLGPSQFSDRRVQWRRNDRGGRVEYGVLAYHGTIVRKGANGQPEYEHCPHAHQKSSAARKCAEAVAKRWNKAEKKEAREQAQP